MENDCGSPHFGGSHCVREAESLLACSLVPIAEPTRKRCHAELDCRLLCGSYRTRFPAVHSKPACMAMPALWPGLSNEALAQGFDCELLYYGRHEKESMQELGVPLVTDLDEFASRCDVITVNVPLTDKTRGMINKEVINKMKKARPTMRSWWENEALLYVGSMRCCSHEQGCSLPLTVSRLCRESCSLQRCFHRSLLHPSKMNDCQQAVRWDAGVVDRQQRPRRYRER